MKLKFINDFNWLQSHQSQWNTVAESYPFFRWSWMANWYRHLGQDLDLAVLIAVDDDDQWIGIAPWGIDTTNPLSTKLRFLGSGVACSDYVNLICDDQHFTEFATLVTDWLEENIGNPNTLGQIDVIELDGLATADSRTEIVQQLMVTHGFASHQTELEGGWAVELPASWEELNQNFSKSMRRKTKKAVRRVADPETEVLSTRDVELDQLWPMFTQLHQKRREMLGQVGCFGQPGFEAFLKSATTELIAESRAELVAIVYQGRPLATMLMLNDDQSVYTYQTGMDVSRLDLEPGYQICYTVLARSIEFGFKNLDFLRGDEPYKSRWNTRRVPICRMRFIPHNAMAKLKHNIWLTGRSIKHYVTQAHQDRS